MAATSALKIAHRGVPLLAPENTMAAFRLAVQLGADGIECDIQRTKDGHLVVIHDDSVDRTTAGAGKVRDMTLAELSRLDAGIKYSPQFAGEAVPSLDDLLSWASARMIIDIEIKGGSTIYPGIEEQLLEMLRRHRAFDRVLISSFDHHALREMRRAQPRLRTGMLYCGQPVDPFSMARWCSATAIHPEHDFLTPELIRAAHAGGFAVWAWTVDDVETAAKLCDWGVDAIISNHPDVLKGDGRS